MLIVRDACAVLSLKNTNMLVLASIFHAQFIFFKSSKNYIVEPFFYICI